MKIVPDRAAAPREFEFSRRAVRVREAHQSERCRSRPGRCRGKRRPSALPSCASLDVASAAATSGGFWGARGAVGCRRNRHAQHPCGSRRGTRDRSGPGWVVVRVCLAFFSRGSAAHPHAHDGQGPLGDRGEDAAGQTRAGANGSLGRPAADRRRDRERAGDRVPQGSAAGDDRLCHRHGRRSKSPCSERQGAEGLCRRP